MYSVYLCPKSSRYVPYEYISHYVINALVASEDTTFWHHEGFDWFELKESFIVNLKNFAYVRGGSTLTQQLVKNLYLNQEKTITRKFVEVMLTYKVENILSKKEILEKYLNVVEFGNRIYGIYNASQKFFEKHPSELNLIESIYLISLLPNPKKLSYAYLNEKVYSKVNKKRMAVIANRLLARKKIDPWEADELIDFLY
jgi:monofunctional biosynthetic peptidoglycan transglycosylase